MMWSTWVLVGIGILVLEFFIPSAFFLFVIGISGIISGALLGTGWFPEGNFQLGLFAALLVFNLLFVRRQIAERFLRASPGVANEFIGGELVALTDIPAGGEGKGNYRGSAWTVRNDGSASLKSGEASKITKIDGLTLYITKN